MSIIYKRKKGRRKEVRKEGRKERKRGEKEKEGEEKKRITTDSYTHKQAKIKNRKKIYM